MNNHTLTSAIENADTFPPTINSHKRIQKECPDGTSFSVSHDDLISLAILRKKDWNLHEIAKLWEILESTEEPIRDLFHYCEGTIKKIRILNNLSKPKK